MQQSAVTEPTFILRPSMSRGHSDHGWLKSFHTFALGAYHTEEPREHAWGPLRVLNEDRVAPTNGFPTHSHNEFEIFSIVVDGAIKHADSMGNVEDLKRGDVQMTSAGTGIRHSEYNGGTGLEGLHFLQIWAKPYTMGLKPAYYTRHFTDEEKTGKLVPVVAPLDFDGVTDTREGTGPAPIHSFLIVYTSILALNTSVSHTFTSETPRKGYVHVIMRKGGYRYHSPNIPEPTGGPKLLVECGSQFVELAEGDGLYMDGMKGATVKFESSGDAEVEFVLFDLDNK